MSDLKNKRLILASKEAKPPLSIDEVPVPAPPAIGAIVKVRYSGVCRSDVSCWKDDWCPNEPFPRVFGHEIAGYVHSLGAKAKSDIKVGDAVMVFGPIGCRTCPVCKGGHSRLCSEDSAGLAPFYGLTRDGGFQNYVLIDEVEDLIKLDKSLPLDVACLLPCGGLTAFNAIATVKDSIDFAMQTAGKATFAVVGAGGLGIWAIHEARAIWPKNLKIVVVDNSEDKLKQSKEEGAEVTFLMDPKQSAEELAKNLKKACGGGIDGSVDFVNIEQTVGTMFYAANKNGTLALIGIAKTATMHPVILRHFPCRTIHIRGVFMGTKKQLCELHDLVVNSGLKPPPFCHVTMDDVNGVFSSLLAGQYPGRAIIDMEK